MGLEAKCRARVEDRLVTGRLHLDSASLSFGGRGCKWSLDLGPGVKTKVEQGWLLVSFGKRQASFELGDDAAKWTEKIQNPPSRAKKLGIKAGSRCWLFGKFPADFLSELASSGTEVAADFEKDVLAFVLVETKRDLKRVVATAARLSPRQSLWIVWPKGDAQLTQADVMNCAASCGMGPSKVAAFDKRLTAMRYAKK